MRPYTQQRLELLNNVENPTLGQQLGRLCIRAKLPDTHVAHALEVSRMTVHTWYKGGDIRKRNREMIDLFMKYVQRDMDIGVLPAKDTATATAYIEQLSGIPMKK